MRSLLVLIVVIGMVGVLGCGPGNPTTYQAEGVVTFDGKPLADATVQFMPNDVEAKSAFGKTDASGAFVLRTFGEADGAMAGTYKVAVTKTEQVQQGVQKGGENAGEPMLVDKSLLPAKYANKSTTPLEFEVKSSGDNKFTIELTK